MKMLRLGCRHSLIMANARDSTVRDWFTARSYRTDSWLEAAIEYIEKAGGIDKLHSAMEQRDFKFLEDAGIPEFVVKFFMLGQEFLNSSSNSASFDSGVGVDASGALLAAGRGAGRGRGADYGGGVAAGRGAPVPMPGRGRATNKWYHWRM
jgi:hypothetical protein